MNNIADDKVIRAMFAFALGVVFLVIQFAMIEATNLFLVSLGVIWCLTSLIWIVKTVKEDWSAP